VKERTMNKHLLMALFGATALLAACGGGYDGAMPAPAPAPAATDEVPPSASASAAGLKGYLVALSNSTADDKEPLSLASFTPVLSDDTEPEPVN
jgi:hypothetical protein